MNPECIWTLINKPIVVSIISVTLGGLCYSYISFRRDKRQKKSDKAIEFINETAKLINTPLSGIFGQIRYNCFMENKELLKDVSVLFTNRFNVKLKSKAYLNSDNFHKKYEEIMWEISNLTTIITESNKNSEKLLLEIGEKKIELEKLWNITTNYSKSNPNSDLLLKNLLDYTHLIYTHSLKLMATQLDNQF